MRLKTRWAAPLFVLAVSANSAFAIDPALSLDQNVIRTWGVDQGLPQGTVYALAQTADGYVWAATQEGFVRFDGTEFLTYDKAAAPQIHNNMTYALLSARDGSLYLIEINPNPDIGPGSGFRKALETAKVPFSEFLETLIMAAYARCADEDPSSSKQRSRPHP